MSKITLEYKDNNDIKSIDIPLEQINDKFIKNFFSDKELVLLTLKIQDATMCIAVMDYCNISDEVNCYCVYSLSVSDETNYGRMHQRYYSVDDAVKCFMARAKANDPHQTIGESDSFEKVFIKTKKTMEFRNHYTYLNMILTDFWIMVFNKTPEEMWCAGIVSAHGDKCDRTNRDWKEAGIPFNHGALLFLLTYTKLMDYEKCEYSKWVIDNYPKYKDIIIKIEQDIIKRFI